MTQPESHWQPIKRWRRRFGQGRIVKTAAEMKAEIQAQIEAAERARREEAPGDAAATGDD